MTVFGFYVFDRHCTCTFYACYGGKPPKASPASLPNVFTTTPPPRPVSSSSSQSVPNGTAKEEEDLVMQRFERNGLVFDEEAKLVFGIIFSLRNLVTKLSLRSTDTFNSFSTTTYKLHYLQTATSTHFVLLTSPTNDSCQNLLREIHTGPFLEHVIRNNEIKLEGEGGGGGIDNVKFREGVDALVRRLV